MAQPPATQFSGIFVSYRRDDSSGHAGRLFDNLANHFGEDQIFMDIDTIEPGEDFVEVIEKAVGSCEIVLAVMGPRWLSSSDGELRRLDNPNDFVRLEIATTLKRNIRLIPVLVQKATMPRPQDLPEDIAALSRRNAIEISDSRWQYDVAKLIRVVEKVLAARREASAEAARQADEERQRQEAEERRSAEEQRRLAAEEEKRRAAEERRQEEEREREAQEETRRAEEELKRMRALEEAHRSERETQERLAEEEKQRDEREESTFYQQRLRRAQEVRRAEEERRVKEERQRKAQEMRLAEEETKRRSAEEADRRGAERQRQEEETKRREAEEQSKQDTQEASRQRAEKERAQAEAETPWAADEKAGRRVVSWEATRRAAEESQARAEKERIGREAEADARQHDVDQGLHGSGEEKSTMPDAPAVAPHASSETAPQMPDSLALDDSTRVVIIVCVVLAIIAFAWALSAN